MISLPNQQFWIELHLLNRRAIAGLDYDSRLWYFQLTKDKLAKELEVAHQQLAGMKAELEEEDERSIHSDDDISEYALELQDRYKFRREILDRIEDKEKVNHLFYKPMVAKYF